MDTTELFILITDIIGTIAFAVSGAIAGVRKKMDVFGVNILANNIYICIARII